MVAETCVAQWCVCSFTGDVSLCCFFFPVSSSCCWLASIGSVYLPASIFNQSVKFGQHDHRDSNLKVMSCVTVAQL